MWFSSKHKPMTAENVPFFCRCEVDLPLYGCPDVTLFNCARVTVSVLFQDFWGFFLVTRVPMDPDRLHQNKHVPERRFYAANKCHWENNNNKNNIY